MRTRQKHLLMLAGIAALSAACALVLPSDGVAVAVLVPGRSADFPHAVHLSEDVGLSCVDCHFSAEDDKTAGMPMLDGCLLCHDEDTDAGKPTRLTPQGFVVVPEEGARWSQVMAASVDSEFSHAVHYEAGADCETCHAGVAESTAVSPSWHLGMADCLRCHESLGVEDGGCLGCHAEVDENTPPANHDAFWQTFHGKSVGFGDLAAARVEEKCIVCHKESECASCHAKTEPSSHTEPWRKRGHGFAAILNRDTCATCHKEDSCVRCHSQTSPSSHGTAMFAGSKNLHCVSCHEPLGSAENCSACHKDTRSHLRGPRRPPNPHPGSGANCRACHFTGSRLKHFDNGQTCTACHR